jgi:fructokinase
LLPLKHVLVGIGEILWDLLPLGRQLGGAPTNFAYHASILGEEGVVVSRVGKDELGFEIIEHVTGLRLSPDFITLDESHPTGTVTVALDQMGIPDFTIHEGVAWDYLPDEKALSRLANKADAVCFGSLAQRSPISRNTIENFLENMPPTALRIFDINLRQSYFSKEVIHNSLKAANILKLNEQELQILSEMFAFEEDEHTLLMKFLKNFNLKMVALTKGVNGSVLYDRDRFSIHPGYTVNVLDTVGAGDAFTAAMAIGILKGHELDRINERANQIASYVCTQSGGTPPIPREFIGMFQV